MLSGIPYQDPIDQGHLIQEAGGFKNPRTGFLYPARHEIPVFLTAGAVEGPNARYQRLYDRFAPLYDAATRLYAWWKSGAEATRRRAYLDLLELHDGASFLEVSVGTGANWRYLNPNLDFHGLDLSAGMLARCRRRARQLKLRFQLCQGLAEHLPFPDSSFDCVFHMGGINFFTDPGAALREMVRVAKPGTRLVVVDETEELARRNEDKLVGGAFFKNRPRTIVAPVNLLPPGMLEVAVREIWDRELFVLTFRKP
ncbi:MAG TPA: class I SAM-dependent methyltransferase [Bryobacteraceae bacterium]|jgi:ubiquinone/menaquinone biosynthesis C-methylase UbiE|nr:class I SAM-dependent methyltransferase [Bryobacteraceae bacterium]